MHSFQFSLSASRGSVFFARLRLPDIESLPPCLRLWLRLWSGQNIITPEITGALCHLPEMSRAEPGRLGNRERQRKDNVGERRIEQQIKICEILLIILLASLLWLPCLCSPLFLSIVIFQARPGITNSDVTGMQMWRHREHHQHCHNHGILSDNYNHQQYTLISWILIHSTSPSRAWHVAHPTSPLKVLL